MIKTRQKKACLRKLKKLLKSSWNNWNRFILVIQTEITKTTMLLCDASICERSASIEG